MATWKQVQAAMMHLDGLQQIRDEVLTAETVDQKAMVDRMALQKSVLSDPDVVAGMAVWAGLGVDEAIDYAQQCDTLVALSKESLDQRVQQQAVTGAAVPSVSVTLNGAASIVTR